MAKTVRQVIRIDEDLCDGCGVCVPSCAEGALQIIDGKARMATDKYCDGLGACLGECPQGAISFETREAEEFDEEATVEHLVKDLGRTPDAHFQHMAEHAAGGQDHDHGHAHAPAAHAHGHGGGHMCPSARTIDRTHETRQEEPTAANAVQSELRQWPVKLYLVNPQAPYFQDADLLVAADCVPFAYGSLHPDFLKGKTLVTGCPKFDDVDLYREKLTEIVRQNNVRSITVLVMEVPCCTGMRFIAEDAVKAAGKDVPVETVTISLAGEVKARAAAA